MVNLSVCVIGKNEAANLPRNIQSLRELESLNLVTETIYVDSSSIDDSVKIAKDFFSKTIVLAESPNLCAAAGRYVGTQEASGDWILYLDADMTIQPEFLRFLSEICRERPCNIGWVGRCDYIFDDGSLARNVGPKRHANKPVPNFGGAVLLPRQQVIAAGNWAAGVFSNEEFELYTRLKDAGCRVLFCDVDMVLHYTAKQSKLRSLFSIFVPSAGLGKKFFGFGQLINRRWRQRSLLAYMQHNPYPFAWLATLLLSVLLFLLEQGVVSALILALGASYIIFAKGVKGLIFSSALVVQGILGFSRFDTTYVPAVRHVHHFG